MKNHRNLREAAGMPWFLTLKTSMVTAIKTQCSETMSERKYSTMTSEKTKSKVTATTYISFSTMNSLPGCSLRWQ
jgi:hypothetical protein